MKITKIPLLVTILLVIGCASESPEQFRQRQRQSEQQAEIARENAIKVYSKKCREYGFQAGTTAFAQCLQQADQQNQMENAMLFQNYQNQQPTAQDHFRRAQCYATGRLDC